MSEIKFKTFKDLKSLSNSTINPKSTNTSISSNTSTPSISSITSIPNQSDKSEIKSYSQKNKKSSLPISPNRDYQKVPNSVTREAIPAGFFRGKSKQVWDYLWSISRGAIIPTRTVSRSRKQIKDGAGLGSLVTVDAAIEHLQAIRLIEVRQSIGSYSGNEYEIFSPEEVQDRYTSISSISSTTSLTQKVDILDIPENSISSITQTQENKPTYADAKTSLKTSTKNDDEKAFAIFAEKLDEASRKLTGKGTSPVEAEKWGKLAELLILELELAARNTKSITSVPAFLTELLRRRLILSPEEKKKSGTNKPHQTKPNWIDVGKNYDDVESSYNPETGEYDIKPLSEAGKTKALELVYEAKTEGGGEFLEDLKKWYLPEDWEWLTKELESRLKKERFQDGTDKD
ncbi:MAG: hypothetical protein WA584_23730 [Pyrinomonadaceae bacterium]